MILPDASVDHPRYRDWLDALVNGPAGYGMSWRVLVSVIRIAIAGE